MTGNKNDLILLILSVRIPLGSIGRHYYLLTALLQDIAEVDSPRWDPGQSGGGRTAQTKEVKASREVWPSSRQHVGT